MLVGAILGVFLIPLVIAYFISNAYKKPKNFPPGPPSLPIYGAFPILRALGMGDLGKACTKLCDMYKTKVLGFYLSVFPCVVVNDPKLMKEMLHREEFDGRLDIFVGRMRSNWKRLGIFFTDGFFWQTQRRFAFCALRDNGFGRRDENVESVVEADIKEMIDMAVNGPKYAAEKNIVKGDLVYLQYFLSAPIMNALLYVFARMTLPRSEYHRIHKLAKNALLFNRATDDFGGALTLTPSLRNIAPNWCGYNDLKNGNQVLLDFATELVDEMLATHDPSHDRHFIDVYIKKMKQERETQEKTTFSEDQLRLLFTDHLLPSAGGPQTVMVMLIERMLIQPEIQDKIHEEIDRVVGRDRLPTLDDRCNMPYTEACIRETLRYYPLVPMGVPHRCCKDTTLGGYDLPEGAMVTNNYVSLHHDKEIWGDPENFRPERFIVNGKLDVSKDKSLPFSAGRRFCPGDTFSRQTIFQVLSGFMQAFQVSPVGSRPTKPVPRIYGVVLTMPEMWVRITPRKCT